jgi:WD40 repeat protein
MVPCLRDGTAAVALFLVGSAVGWAFRPGAGEPPAAPVEEEWPAPAQDSIDYLAAIDPRTLLPRLPDREAARYDYAGAPLPPGIRVRLCPSGARFTENSPLERIVIAPDGKWAATAGCQGTVCVFDLATGRQIHRLRDHRGTCLALAFTADGGKLLAAGLSSAASPNSHTGWEVSTLDLATGMQTDSPYGERPVAAVAFSGDGALAGVAHADGAVELWDPATGTLRQRFQATESVTSLALSPDGGLLALGTRQGTLRLADSAGANEGDEIAKVAERCEFVKFSPDGRRLFFGWNFQTAVCDLAGRTVLPHHFRAGRFKGDRVAVSPDGRTIVANGIADRIALKEVHTGLRRRELELPFGCTTGAFTPDGRAFVAGLLDGSAEVHDLPQPAAGARALTPEELDQLWQTLGKPEAEAAYDALWALAAAPDSAIPFLVRRANRDLGMPTAEQIRAAIADLDSPEFAVREKATDDLARMGRAAQPALGKARAAKPSLEATRRLESLLDALKKPENVPDHLDIRRAIETLETIGGATARRALEEIADNCQDEEARADARASLDRLRRFTPRSAVGAPP